MSARLRPELAGVYDAAVIDRLLPTLRFKVAEPEEPDAGSAEP